MVMALACNSRGHEFNSQPFLGQVVRTHVPLSPSSIFWYSHLAVMSCDWEGNRRSGELPDLLAVCHRLKWFIHLRAQGLCNGDEHPTNTPHGVWYSLPLPYLDTVVCVTGVQPVKDQL